MWSYAQLIFSVLKTLQDQELTVELKNDLAITGQLKSVDQCARSTAPDTGWPLVLTSIACRVGNRPHRFLNIKLDNIRVQDEERYPHMVRPSSTRLPLTARLHRPKTRR